jgi:mannose-6-phosphate isomerase-like protein (cupin superfamily)
MIEPTVIPAGEGEVVGDSPERRVEILSDHDALHVTWSRFGPGREGADLHVHRRHTDLFYVLEGELTVRLGLEDEPVAVPAGTLARVPPLVVHGFRNGGAAEVRYLNFHAPGQGFAEFMRALRDGRDLTYDQEPPPREGVRPAREAVVGGDGPVRDGRGLRERMLADVDHIRISEVSIGPAGSSRPRQLDRLTCLYVLEGELVLAAGERELRAGAGDWVQVPPGTSHSFSAPGPARFLDMHAPLA